MDGTEFTVDEYAALVRSLPPPTLEQKYAFAEAVSHAHSWYKNHIAPAYASACGFFVDPAAGMELVMEDDRTTLIPRLKTGFHYNAIPTALYRERYGFLSCTAYTGRTFVKRNSAGVTQLAGPMDSAFVFDAALVTHRVLPEEVLALGRTRFSGIVHSQCVKSPGILLRHDMATEGVWHKKSGGEAVRKRIVELAGDGREPHTSRDDEALSTLISATEFRNFASDFYGYHVDLLRLVQPERRRQHHNMVAAMDRVLLLAMTHA